MEESDEQSGLGVLSFFLLLSGRENCNDKKIGRFSLESLESGPGSCAGSPTVTPDKPENPAVLFRDKKIDPKPASIVATEPLIAAPDD